MKIVITNILKPGFVIMVLVFLIIGCSSQRNSVKITILSPSEGKSSVKLTVYKDLDETILMADNLDSTGSLILEFELNQPIIATIQIGDKYGELYLNKGYNLLISDNKTSNDKKFTYSGYGSDINNYFANVNYISENIKLADNQYIAQLDVMRFLDRLDSLETALDSFHHHYVDSLKLSGIQQNLLATHIKIKITSIYQEYVYKQINDAVNSKLRNPKINLDSVLANSSVELRSKEYDVIFDSTFLKLGSISYEYLFQTFLKIKFYTPNYDFTNWEGMKEHLPVTTNMAIRNSTVSNVFKEYLIAQNIKHWLRYYGITHATDSIFGNFKNEFKDSQYLPSLEKDYNAWLKISTGSLAPDFNGTTIDGKPFILSQLKGKIVYIDMWATWCAPCIEEIPHSIKLQKELGGINDLVFLNVSNDINLESWKRKLLSDKDWKGMHIVQSPEQIKLTWKVYRIYGLPMYILIDKAGNIVEANATRPSEGKIKDQIEALLNKKI